MQHLTSPLPRMTIELISTTFSHFCLKHMYERVPAVLAWTYAQSARSRKLGAEAEPLTHIIMDNAGETAYKCISIASHTQVEADMLPPTHKGRVSWGLTGHLREHSRIVFARHHNLGFDGKGRICLPNLLLLSYWTY